MIRRLKLLMILLIAFAYIGCATSKPPNPFKISEDEFFNKIKIVALAPLILPRELSDQSLGAKFYFLIEAKLRAAGFQVIPSQESLIMQQRLTKQVGGYYDPLTGKVDEEKYKTIMKDIRQELDTKFKANALLRPVVQAVPARVSGSFALWDGTEEKIVKIFSLHGSWRGQISALSLSIAIEDMSGFDMYYNRGGIQVLSRISRSGQIINIPQNELLTDEDRIAASVNIALGPLLKESTHKKIDASRGPVDVGAMQRNITTEKPPLEQTQQSEAPNDYGIISITSDPPGAKIFIDGEFKGETPAAISLNTGTYQIFLQRQLYEPYKDSVMIEKGQTKTLDIKLSPKGKEQK